MIYLHLTQYILTISNLIPVSLKKTMSTGGANMTSRMQQ
jgi:hypothetical protein